MSVTMIHQNATDFAPTAVSIKQQTSTHYTVPFTGPIGEIHEYRELIGILALANELDEIYIQLSSPGGNLDTCDYLCRRMDECDAKITVEIGMTCASAASAIALHADSWVIYDSSTMMIHSCSYTPGYGKETDIWRTAQFTKQVNEGWIKRTYTGFLFEDEITDILEHGKDLYLHADDLRDRLPEYSEYRKKCKTKKIEEIIQYWEERSAA